MDMQSSLVTPRRGVSLIELLVVIAIITALAVTVIPNVTNTAEARRGREAARMVSSFIAKAHSRAIGRREPAGLMVTSVGPASFAAIDLFLADVPPPYRGDTVNATLTVSGSGQPRRTAVPSPGSPGALDDVVTISATTSDLIRFGGRGPFYQLTSPPTPAGVEIRMQGFEDSNLSPDDLGYTSRNTPWPATEPLAFEIFRQPQSSGSPLSLDGGRAVDLFWSGYGPPRVDRANGTTVTDTYRRFTASGSRISVVFDGTGRLRQVVEASPAATNRRAVTGAVFLLIGRLDRINGDPNAANTFNSTDDATGANWQYPDSWWVAIDPLTGMTKIAECKPGVATVEDSQQWVREALLASGR
jgi:prepilin-type N-terminal cleavage/methylation domain-containing protein